MGVRRYSPLLSVRRAQERFDELQMLCRWSYGTPTIATLRAAGIHRAYARCRNYECLRSGASFYLATLPDDAEVATVRRRRRFTCGKCGTTRAEFRLIWEE